MILKYKLKHEILQFKINLTLEFMFFFYFFIFLCTKPIYQIILCLRKNRVIIWFFRSQSAFIRMLILYTSVKQHYAVNNIAKAIHSFFKTPALRSLNFLCAVLNNS